MSTDSVPPTRRASRCQVIVIGGGFAGMAIVRGMLARFETETFGLVVKGIAHEQT